MAPTELDRQRLTEALQLAEQAIGLSDPNPRVGCVIGLPDGRVLGRGSTQAAGSAHAEVMALRDAAAAGVSTSGATAWVTLEPCAHHGRTPPCCDALIAAGIARVVTATRDSFPHVDGRGIARLRAAGVEVLEWPVDDGLHRRARELNVGFFARVERGRPWVRMKLAASLDGRTALPDGTSQWITGEAARADGHAWRRRAGAVLTGIGTVLADDPRLDVRHVSTARQPLRVVVDSALRTPPGARLLNPADSGVWIVGARADAQREAALRGAGAQVMLRPATGSGVDLAAVIDALAAQPVNEVHVEAGPRLNGALLAAGLVDEVLLYLAPRLLGPGRELAVLPALSAIDDGIALSFFECHPVGGDLRLRARVAARRGSSPCHGLSESLTPHP
jgi:diaminohydroxyphosphoribosylaminopyrimidine deaminase/5-amino-6-(5-phosphoribosylamino)uracil reductase